MRSLERLIAPLTYKMLSTTDDGSSGSVTTEGGGEGAVSAEETTAFESVFTQWQHADALLIMCFMALLILFTLAFDLVLRVIEHRVKMHSHYMKILTSIYKELMVLGFASFLILVVRSSAHLSETIVLTLELVHLWIFFLAVTYIIQSTVLLLLARHTKKKWDIASHKSPNDLLETYQQQMEKSTMTSYRFLIIVKDWLWEPAVFRQIKFHLVRDLFIRTYKLEDVQLDVAKYLRRCLSTHITHQLEIQSTSWLIALIILGANVLRIHITNISSNISETFSTGTCWLYFAVGYILLAFAIALYVLTEISEVRLFRKMQAQNRYQLGTALQAIIATQPVRQAAELARRQRAYTMSHANGEHAAGTSRANSMSQTQIPLYHTPMHRRAAAVDHTSENPLIQPKKSLADIAYTEQQVKLANVETLPAMIDNLFVLSRPHLIARATELLMLLQSFLVGIVALLTSQQALYLWGNATGALYIVFSVLPHLLITGFLMPRVVENYILCHSIAHINVKALNHVAEHTEAINQLRCTLSRRIMHSILILRVDLQGIFNSMDTSHDFKISFTELQIGIQKLKIYLSGKQLSRMMRLIDHDGSNKLDFKEFQQMAKFEQTFLHLSDRAYMKLLQDTLPEDSMPKSPSENATNKQRTRTGSRYVLDTESLKNLKLIGSDEAAFPAEEQVLGFAGDEEHDNGKAEADPLGSIKSRNHASIMLHRQRSHEPVTPASNEFVTISRCFANASVQCQQCRELVSVLVLEAHSRRCEHSKDDVDDGRRNSKDGDNEKTALHSEPNQLQPITSCTLNHTPTRVTHSRLKSRVSNASTDAVTLDMIKEDEDNECTVIRSADMLGGAMSLEHCSSDEETETDCERTEAPTHAPLTETRTSTASPSDITIYQRTESPPSPTQPSTHTP